MDCGSIIQRRILNGGTKMAVLIENEVKAGKSLAADRRNSEKRS